MNKIKTRIGIVGTGFIGKGLAKALAKHKEFEVAAILTRRPLHEINDVSASVKVTNRIEIFLNRSDIVVECSGDILHGTEVIASALQDGLPVVTMNAELQVTTGSYFAGKGIITEAEGDQPGCLAAFRENVMDMGFEPLVYGNIKGFLNLNPTKKEMIYWSTLKGISLPMVTSFTDGTKVQIEQALVANGLNTAITGQGLTGAAVQSASEGGDILAKKAEEMNQPISDYIVCPAGPPGIFITGKHELNQKEALSYLKMGEGPYYTLTTSFHICHLEIIKTLKRITSGKGILLNNSTSPTVSVGAIAKKRLMPGEVIHKGIGSFQVRGEALQINSNMAHVPIGLLEEATINKPIEAGEMITWSDVELPKSLALRAWKETMKKIHPATQAEFIGSE